MGWSATWACRLGLIFLKYIDDARFSAPTATLLTIAITKPARQDHFRGMCASPNSEWPGGQPVYDWLATHGDGGMRACSWALLHAAEVSAPTPEPFAASVPAFVEMS